MKKTLLILMGSALSLCAADPVAGMYQAQFKIAQSEVVSLAMAMPEAAYNFAPTNGSFEKVRTFASQVKHLASVIYICASTANQEKPPVDIGAGEDGPANMTSKADIVKYLQGAFEYGGSTMGKLTAASQVEMVKGPFPGMGDTPRGAVLMIPIWHSFDHYGQMVVYARMNKVIPPASQPAPPPTGTKKK